jgi:glycine cleavage system H protein
MNVPENLLYTKDHEWIKLEGEEGIIGITDYAQDKLGDIVFLEIKEVGTKVKQFEEIGTIESVKAASDIYSPVTGEIIQVNSEVIDTPEIINKDPYLKGWMAKIKIEDKNELNNLLKPDDYKKLIGEKE